MARLEAVTAGPIAGGDGRGLILEEDAVLGVAFGQGEVGAPAIEAAVDPVSTGTAPFTGGVAFVGRSVWRDEAVGFWQRGCARRDRI